MRKAVRVAAAMAALAVLGWWAARRLPPTGISGADAQTPLRALEEIFRSRNDNDPRLDRDFNALSEETKRQFRQEYHKLSAERRNDRGIIVYLLGKNLQTAADWEFLRQVAAEPPCLSLSDCSKKPESSGGGALGDEVTLAYPSLVALKKAQRVLEEAPRSKEALGVIAAGKGSRSPAVVRLAERLERQYAPQAP